MNNSKGLPDGAPLFAIAIVVIVVVAVMGTATALIGASWW